MLLNFTSEERALLATVDACIDIPRSTKPAVARKLYDNLKNLVRQLRGLAPVLESRGLGLHTKSATRVADARALLFKYQVPAEELIPRRRVYGDSAALEDACLQLRAAAYARQGVALRYQSGSAEDPQESFRDDEGKIYPENARTTAEHQESVKYHTNCAAKAKSLNEAESHFHASDRHAYAAAYPNDTLASDRARQASRVIRS